MAIPYRQKIKDKGPRFDPFLLYILPLPLLLVIVLALINGSFWRMIFAVLALGLVWMAAWFLQQGARFEREARRRKWARPTRVPWRFSAAIFAAVAALIIGSFIVGHNLLVGALAAIGAFAGVIMTYGFDPQYDKNQDVSRFGVTTEEIIEALKEAEHNLGQIESSAAVISNSELKVRLGRIVDKTRGVLSLIEEDPKRLETGEEISQGLSDRGKQCHQAICSNT